MVMLSYFLQNNAKNTGTKPRSSYEQCSPAIVDTGHIKTNIK